MSGVKKQLSTLSVLFSVGFLSLSFFTYGTFFWNVQQVLPLLNAASRIDASVVNLYSPGKAGGRVALKMYGETRCSEMFLSAEQNAELLRRSLLVFPLRFKASLAAKIPRYILKSVLNI